MTDTTAAPNATPMTAEQWQADNGRYLAASLRWLRLRLERLAPDEPLPLQPIAPAAALAPAPASQPRLFHRLFAGSPGNHVARDVPLLPEGNPPSLDDQIEQAQAERDAIAAGMQPTPALLTLARQMGLSGFEQDVTLLCAAMELDTRAWSLCARAQGDPGKPYPTFALALALFDQPGWDALSPERPLRYWRLIEINQPGATPLTMSALRADERIVAYLKGLNALDDRLASLLAPVMAPASALAPSQQDSVEAVLDHWRRPPEGLPLPVAQLTGVDGESKAWIARQAALAVGRYLYRLEADALPAQHGELEWLARLWQRESLLLPLALFVDAQHLDESVQGRGALNRFLSRATEGNGPIFLGVREALPRLTCTSFTVETSKPTSTEQRAAWREVLEVSTSLDEADAIAARLAGQFDLDLSQIERLASANEPSRDRLWDASAAITRPRLDALAQRLTPKATWDDLVLPDEPARLLRLIAAQVRQRSKVYEDWGFARRMNRGMGISALFAGESGTGKTIAAEVIANELRLHLYRIDLSAVVSKYIGETEKNLRQLFDAAEGGGAILFFDEADALFGKRSEVKDSHDRYANIEINYLLQRMEAYRGLAILATNMKSALDPAFMRRLRFIVNFTFPGLAERKLMWRKAFPGEMPAEGLDYERLAKLNLTGGNIHSIAVNAAFLAAERGSAVTMPIVLEVARMEFRKLDKPVNEADFR
jgi:hypothetical protein